LPIGKPNTRNEEALVIYSSHGRSGAKSYHRVVIVNRLDQANS
jgi:hypothetical protein